MSVAPTVRRFAARFAIALVTVAAITSVAFVAASRTVSDVTDQIERVDVVVDEAPPLKEPEAGNYLIVGSDSRAFAVGDPRGEESFGTVEGARGDTLMVAHVDPSIKQVLFVSFPRDLLVEIPGHGQAKINSALDYGPDVLAETFRVNFDIPIHHYINVDFASFSSLVDAMGGVKVNIAYPVRDWHRDEDGNWVNETGLDLGAGCQLLNGEQALSYVRTRYYQEERNGKWQSDPTADLGRITRQQQFVRVLASAARERALSNPLDAKGLADAAVSNLTADRALEQAEILGALNTFRDLDPGNPESLEMQPLPVVSGGNVRNVGSVLVMQQPQAEELLVRLRVFAPPTTTTTAPPTTKPTTTAKGATTTTVAPTAPPETEPPPVTTAPVSGTPIERC